MKKESSIALALYIILYLPFVVFFFQEGIAKGLSLYQFNGLFFSEGNYIILIKSIGISLLSSMLSLTIGFLVAFAVTRSGIRYMQWFSFLYLLPLAIPGFVYVEAVVFLSEVTGKNLFTLPVMILLLSVVYMPVSAIIINAGLRAVPKSIEESALLVSPKNRWFIRITLPWMRPYFITAFVLTFLFSFANYEIPSLMNVQTYTLFIFNQFGAFYNFLNALYLTLPVFAIFILIIIAERFVVGKRAFFDLSIGEKGIAVDTKYYIRFLLICLFVTISIIIILPFAILIFKASSVRSIPEAVVPYWKEVGYSLILSITGAVVTICIGILFVRCMITSIKKQRYIFLTLAFIPFAIPPAFLAIGLIKISGSLFGTSSIGATGALTWGLSARYFPIVLHILYAGAVTVNPRFMESAALTCGRGWKNVTNIWLPLNFRTIQQAFFFFIILALAEIGLAVLLVPPDCMTAAVNIYSMLHYGFEKEVVVETLMILVLVVILGILILRFRRQKLNGICEGVA